MDTTDLASALVELGRAAADRRHARHDLRASTEVVAGAIVKQLRDGDSCSVEGTTYRVASISLECVDVEVPEHTYTWKDTEPALLVGDAVLSRLSAAPGKTVQLEHEQAEEWGMSSFIRFTGGARDSDGLVLHRATDAEREAFCTHAGAVITGFVDAVDNDAERMERHAELVAELTPRST